MAQLKKFICNSSLLTKNVNQHTIDGLNVINNGDEVPVDIQIIAQEVQIVKSLSCNDLKQRNRQMKRLRKWLQIRTKSSFTFNQENFMRIWKGLYYNMWYSDKPLVQEELAEQLGKLLECFEGNLQNGVDFFGAFLKTMCIEWFGIDQWRIDKFLMLTRRMLRYMFKLLKSSHWSLDAIEVFNRHAAETVLFENVSAKGLTMHYFDIFFEELAKVSDGSISGEQVGMFAKPFVKFMATQRDFNLISHCRTRVFYHLLYQSALGREYTEKYNAWKDMGFPTKHINDLEKVEGSEDDNCIEIENANDCRGNKYLDPRAGNVDVFMPELPLDAECIIKEAEHFLYKGDCATKRRKLIKKLLELFKIYQNGVFPLGVKTMPRFDKKSEKPLIKEKIKRLDNLENELYGVDRKLKQMTKRKRRKFLKSLNFEEIDEKNYEQSIEKALPKDYLRERRKRSQKCFTTGWLEEELNEGDLNPKKAKMEKAIVKGNESAQKWKNNKKLKNHNMKSNKGCVDTLQKLKKAKSFGESSDDPIAKLNTSTNSKDETPAKALLEVENKTTKKNEKLIKTSNCQAEKVPELKTKLSKAFNACDEELEEKPIKETSDWDEPLIDGEIEYFLPSRKIQIKKANVNLVLNPLAKQHIIDKHSTPLSSKQSSVIGSKPLKSPSSTKRVKIALKHNTSQLPVEYIQQIKSSPNIPYDAKKKPGKGLLKPNAMPSPINPFYKKKIGLKFLNDTI